MVEQLVQVAGSLLILTAFAAAQFGRTRQDAVPYLMANVVGSGVLAVLALLERQWGFLLLEGTWCVVSALGLVRRARRAKRVPDRSVE